MSTPKLSSRMLYRLSLINGWETEADRENARRDAQGRFRRVARGMVAVGDATDHALVRRGLVERNETFAGLEPGVSVWSLTDEGRTAL